MTHLLRLSCCLLWLAFAIGAANAQLDLKPPSRPFEAVAAPPAPDYSDKAAWAVWPGRASQADTVPKGVKGGLAKNPDVDVFFVHPTTFFSSTVWNARFDEPGYTRDQLDINVMRFQTSVFNGCCRIYAPRYRQATLGSFLKPGASSNAAFDLAYSDVVRAFDYYMQNENRGRPFIIASHSQGSLHATRLLQERVTGKDAAKRLVAAYVIGASMPEDFGEKGLPVCRTPRQTGCIVNWNSNSSFTPLALGRRIMVTWENGDYRLVGADRWMCVNPITWTRGGAAPAAANLGSLPGVKPDEPLPAISLGVTGARCGRGRLIVSLPRNKRKGFTDPLTKLGSYHNHDYGLFYVNIRQNAIERANAFLGKR